MTSVDEPSGVGPSVARFFREIYGYASGNRRRTPRHERVLTDEQVLLRRTRLSVLLAVLVAVGGLIAVMVQNTDSTAPESTNTLDWPTHMSGPTIEV